MTSKSLKNIRRTQKLGLITLLDKQDREIHGQDKIITELYDSEQSTIIHTNPKDVPEVTSWEMEAALRHMKNVTATYTQRRISTSWKKAKMVIILKEGNKKDLKNYSPICLL